MVLDTFDTRRIFRNDAQCFPFLFFKDDAVQIDNAVLYRDREPFSRDPGGLGQLGLDQFEDLVIAARLGILYIENPL